MKIKSFYITAFLVSGTIFTSCTDYEVKDPNFMPPDVVLNEDPKYNEIIEGYLSLVKCRHTSLP